MHLLRRMSGLWKNINELEQDVWQCNQIELKVKRLAGLKKKKEKTRKRRCWLFIFCCWCYE